MPLPVKLDSFLGLIVFKGKNVAVPSLFCFKNLIQSAAILSSSTTKLLILGPAATSKAKEYLESTFPNSETVP